MHSRPETIHRIAATLAVAAILATGCAQDGVQPSTAPSSAPTTPSPTPQPDPAMVRLEGRFLVTHTYTEAVNSNTFLGDQEFRFYHVTPDCTSGPCDITVASYNPDRDITGEAAYTFEGGVYRFAGEPEVITVTCTVAGESGEYDFELREEVELAVTATDGNDPATATRFEGTRTLSQDPLGEAAAAGCEPDLRVTAFVGVPAEGEPEPTVLPPDPSCEQEGSVKTTVAGSNAQITYENHTGMDLTIYWLDGDGARVDFAELWNHAKLGPQDADEGYWFLLADREERCLQIFHAPARIDINYPATR